MMEKKKHGSVLNKIVIYYNRKIKLIATGTTGSKAEKAGFKVTKMLSVLWEEMQMRRE
jgi:methylglyoxal synthase